MAEFITRTVRTRLSIRHRQVLVHESLGYFEHSYEKRIKNIRDHGMEHIFNQV